MKAVNYLEVPDRMNTLWPWVNAICAYDFGDAEPLAELIRTSEAIPSEFRHAVADALTGKRKPNRRAAAKLKLPAAEMMKIAGSLSVVLGIIDALKYDAAGKEGSGLRGASALAETEWERSGKDATPADVLRALEQEARQAIESAATDLGASTETVENLLREMRRRIKAWPAV